MFPRCAECRTGVCAFTILAAGWLFTMYFVLRHPGYQWRAVVALLLVGQAVATLAALRRRPTLPLRIVVLAGAAAIAAYGATAVIQNSLPANPHFEGFVNLIGLALLVQGVLTLWWGLTRRLVVRSRS